MGNESLNCQHVGNLFPSGAFLPSLTFLAGIDGQIELLSILPLSSNGICILHPSTSLWNDMQRTGYENTFISFQPKRATERSLKRLITAQVRGLSSPQYLSSVRWCHLRPAGFPFKDAYCLFQSMILSCCAEISFLSEMTSGHGEHRVFLSHGSLVHMASPEELVCRRSTSDLSGLSCIWKVYWGFKPSDLGFW